LYFRVFPLVYPLWHYLSLAVHITYYIDLSFISYSLIRVSATYLVLVKKYSLCYIIVLAISKILACSRLCVCMKVRRLGWDEACLSALGLPTRRVGSVWYIFPLSLIKRFLVNLSAS
jgi:hypothetical protein